MKIIKRKISLEKFKSRLPLMIDSFDENGNSIVLNNRKDKIECYPIGNYGMIPCDIIFTTNQVPTFNKNLFKKINNRVYSINYSLLNEMYHFFIEYDALLQTPNCEHESAITSATQYFQPSNVNEEK